MAIYILPPLETAQSPSHEQLEYLEVFGLYGDGLDGPQLSDPKAVEFMQQAVDAGFVRLIGSSLVGLECPEGVQRVIHESPDRFRGLLVTGENAYIDPGLWLSGTFVENAVLTGSYWLRGGYASGGRQPVESVKTPEQDELLPPLEIKFGRHTLEMNPDTHVVRVNGKELVLSLHEFTILYALSERRGKTMSKEELMKILDRRSKMRTDSREPENTRAYMRNLRVKLGTVDEGFKDLVRTNRGAGFFLSPDAIVHPLDQHET